MTPSRLAAIGVIYFAVAFAWFTLGASVTARTGEADSRLSKEVAQLWGGRHVQLAPDAWYEISRSVTEMAEEKEAKGRVKRRPVTRTVVDRVAVPLTASAVGVELALDPRRKGLLWYDTYAVRYRAQHRFRNDGREPRDIRVHFAFPSTEAIYDGFRLVLDGREAQRVTDLSSGLTATTLVPPGADAVLQVEYRSRGLGDWTYAFNKDGIAQVTDFRLDLATDFDGFDFPPGGLSPTSLERRAGGAALAWNFESLVTGQRIALEPPHRLNPGPLAARITFFAPVSLLFFFAVLVVLGVLRGRSLHPMNYLFLAAAFFSFHLLLVYLVDHVDLHASFAIAAATSVLLVTSYLRLVTGLRTALLEAGLAQAVYLVLFSYAFFFEGYAGLTVTIGAVLTLFVLMQLTGRVDWGRAFAGEAAPRAAG
ncbi:MAG TPA: inner membrane CreD family protein [Vicinamibacteria bacterium]|nr:inner membrane CreD family protein [Vicinamibacteria bacterium]